MQQRRFAMKVSTGFAVLALALSAPAAAQPRAEETSGRVRINDVGNPRVTPPVRGEWVELADPSPVKHGTMTVMVGEDAGNFGQLRIEAAKGRVVVLRVKVFFEDGTSKVIHVDKTLRADKANLVDLKLGTPRRIDRIKVTTETYPRGEFAVYGSSATEPGAAVAARRGAPTRR
jgi:hypothetical protein